MGKKSGEVPITQAWELLPFNSGAIVVMKLISLDRMDTFLGEAWNHVAPQAKELPHLENVTV